MIKIYKNEYGWSTPAHNKAKNTKHYVDFQFPMNSEPQGDYIEGDLIFRLPNGEEKKCFLSSYAKKDGSVHTKVVVMDRDEPLRSNELNVQQTLTGNGRDVVGHMDPNIKIDSDELPFY